MSSGNIDINKINKIDTNLITPSTESSLVGIQRDNWGTILNEQTFKTLNNNIRILKDIILEIINNVNLIDIENTRTRLSNIETDTNKLESLINVNLIDIENTRTRLSNIETDTNKLESLINVNEQRTDITTGLATSNYNIVGKEEHLKYNGKNLVNSEEISDFAKLNSSNTFTQKIKGTDIESNKIISQELILNGTNVNLSDYITNINLITQIEEIVGLIYGGNIQDTGNKVKGKFYYDNVTKFYYECLENTDLTYNESSKFRAISNKPILDKVENLPRFYTKTANVDFSNDKFTIKIPKSNFLFGILEVAQKLYGWSNKIIFTEGESCFEHVSNMLSQRLVITTDSQNVYLVSQDKNISLFLINSVTFFYYD